MDGTGNGLADGHSPVDHLYGHTMASRRCPLQAQCGFPMSCRPRIGREGRDRPPFLGAFRAQGEGRALCANVELFTAGGVEAELVEPGGQPPDPFGVGLGFVEEIAHQRHGRCDHGLADVLLGHGYPHSPEGARRLGPLLELDWVSPLFVAL